MVFFFLAFLLNRTCANGIPGARTQKFLKTVIKQNHQKEREKEVNGTYRAGVSLFEKKPVSEARSRPKQKEDRKIKQVRVSLNPEESTQQLLARSPALTQNPSGLSSASL